MLQTRDYIRFACYSDVQALNQLVCDATLAWPYPKECRDALLKAELTLTSAMLAEGFCFVAQRDNTIIGFWFRENINTTHVSRGLLFVGRKFMRQGVAKKLWFAIKNEMIKNGIASFTAIVDPSAVPFYLSIGGVKVGGKESDTIKGAIVFIFRVNLG